MKAGVRASPGGGARWRESEEDRIVGGSIGGRIGFDGAVELGDPNGANFPRGEYHRGTGFIAGDQLLDFARAQVAGDVNVRAFL